MKINHVLSVMTAVAFFVEMANATTWYVHPDSTLNSIQAALDSCVDNDTVLVGPGVYYENIVWPDVMGITLSSELGADSTIIDGDSVGDVILIDSCLNVDTTTIIDGFSIRNGSPNGGIICNNYFQDGSSPTIANNIISSSVSGIFCCSSPKIWNNTITGNTSGIGMYISEALILDNIINYNEGHGIAGYLFAPTIIGNTITHNSGCGFYGDYCSPMISNTVITGNANHGLYFGDGSPIIDHCLIADNGGDGIRFGWAYITYPQVHQSDIVGNTGYGIRNVFSNNIVHAENNWWGDASGPYHSVLNPGGVGDSVSDYVDFEPWLTGPGVGEKPIVKPIEKLNVLNATIFRGALQLPKDTKCRVFDIAGRIVEPNRITHGIYFIEVDSKIVQKVVKIR